MLPSPCSTLLSPRPDLAYLTLPFLTLAVPTATVRPLLFTEDLSKAKRSAAVDTFQTGPVTFPLESAGHLLTANQEICTLRAGMAPLLLFPT